MDEKTLIFENIGKFRQLLKEDVSQSDIESAINNREILYIYYAGDDTIRRGYRTIEPYVLGYIKRKDGNGDLAVRAWQQAGASDTFKNPVGRWAKKPPRKNHEFFNDPNIQPGWRLFKLEGITYVLPTGKYFLQKKGPRPLYKGASDKGLNVIAYAVPPSETGTKNIRGTDSIQEPDVSKQKLPVFDPNSSKWQNVTREEEMKLMANLVALWEKVKTFDKSAPRYYDVTFKDNIYRAIKYNSTDRYKYTNDQVVGNLNDLYNKFSETNPEEMRELTNRLKRIT
jgi:hypothetical protein